MQSWAQNPLAAKKLRMTESAIHPSTVVQKRRAQASNISFQPTGNGQLRVCAQNPVHSDQAGWTWTRYAWSDWRSCAQRRSYSIVLVFFFKLLGRSYQEDHYHLGVQNANKCDSSPGCKGAIWMTSHKCQWITWSTGDQGSPEHKKKKHWTTSLLTTCHFCRQYMGKSFLK